MDYYSILDNDSSQAGQEPAPPNLVASSLASSDLAPSIALPSSDFRNHEAKPGAPAGREGLRFPGEDGGKSLSEMAQRDLDATLQLLAERAQYITGASGAAIALRQGESMVCCASAGPSAPELGAHLQIDSGLSAESVRTRKILICEDAENDPRVNRESCRAFGIASVVVMPLVRGEEVYGVFELLSGRPRAFEERDYVALNRLAEMIQTAVELAEGARRAEKEFGQAQAAAPATAEAGPAAPLAESHAGVGEAGFETRKKEISATEITSEMEPAAAAEPAALHGEIPSRPTLSALDETLGLTPNAEEEAELSTPISTIAFGNLRRCESCGFPVSEGRRLCLDCEASTPGAIASVDTSSDFFGQFDDSRQSWVRSHAYLIATAVIALATIVLLAWRL